MGENSNLGNKIKNAVQDALNTGDFKSLNKDIESVVKTALNEVKTSVNWGSFSNNKNNYNKPKPKQVIYHRGPVTQAGRVPGILFTIFGGIGTVVFGILVTLFLTLGYTMKLEMVLGTLGIGFVPLLIASIASLYNGNRINKRLTRSQRYLAKMNGKGYASIKELSSAVSLSEKNTSKDINNMIKVGIFPEGRIDDKNTHFILNNIVYNDYLKLQEGIMIKKIEEEKLKKEKENKKYIDPEIEETINYGRDFIKKIRDANIEIPGKEISIKLDRLEDITGHIFDYVEVHPEKFSEIKKFTEYFLPTTLKLVETYRKLDSQPIDGENIVNSKKEIEETLDTINDAFENLYDSLYEDMAMDISTDISVLETMLAQEGLTNKDMKINK